MPNPADTAENRLAAGIRAERVPQGTIHAAAQRLVSASLPSGTGPATLAKAADGFLEQARKHDLDLSRLFHTAAEDGIPRQVCLAAPSPGRTAAVFVSGPGDTDAVGDFGAQARERAAAIAACCRAVAEEPGLPIHLLQALPDPSESWFCDALRDAGFLRVGDLSYMRRDIATREPKKPPLADALPQGVTTRTARDLGPGADAVLCAALERTYVGTLDCPQLCGLRETPDVLESHRRAGVYDPTAWHVLYTAEGAAEGCMLLNRVPEQDAVELVYIGLGPELRGMGVAGLLLDEAARYAASVRAGRLTCAVDRANAPALRLYASRRFEPFASRAAYVRSLRA